MGILLQTADTAREILRTAQGMDDTVLFLLFMGLLAIFAAVNITDAQYLRDLFRGVLDTNYLLLLQREGKLSLRINDLLLDLLFTCSFGLFFFKLFSGQTLAELANWVLIIAGYYLVKVILVKIFSHVFFGSAQINFHLLQVLAFNKLMGFVVLPVIFAAFFLDVTAQQILLKLLLYAIIFFLFYRFMRILYNIYLRYPYGIVYGIIYLCTIELTPFLVLYKHFFKVYLY